MSGERTVEVTLEGAEYDRLAAAGDPETLLREGGLHRAAVASAVAGLASDEDGSGPETRQDGVPVAPIGELLGFEVVDIGGGEATLVLEAGPRHANPMGTVHGGVFCDLGDAAMGMAYASTLADGESFTTLELGVNYLRPVFEDRLTATGRVVNQGRSVGLVECDVTNSDGDLVARLSSTCLTLRGDAAAGR